MLCQPFDHPRIPRKSNIIIVIRHGFSSLKRAQEVCRTNSLLHIQVGIQSKGCHLLGTKSRHARLRIQDSPVPPALDSPFLVSNILQTINTHLNLFDMV